MKVLKHKNLMGLIFTVLLSLPLLGIGVRCGYVIANKNAYQSYYGETINQETLHDVNFSDINIGGTYYIYPNSDVGYTGEGGGNSTRLLTINNARNETDNINYSNVVTVAFYQYNSNITIYFFDENNTQVFSCNSNSPKLLSYTLLAKNDYLNSQIQIFNKCTNYYITYNQYSYLDNVFEYSVSQFTSENNLGNVNLFSWFTNMFLSDNAHNNLYVGFANWYMNYAMLVACMHLLFLVLMWFINFARRLLERGMNYDF